MARATYVRRTLLVVCLLSVLFVGTVAVSALSSESSALVADSESDAISPITGDASYRPDSPTVVTSVSGAISSAQERGALFIVAPDGSVTYEEHRYNVYDDVDPSPKGKQTVTYVAAEKLSGSECEGVSTSPCTRNFIERLNYSTGERERLHMEITAHVVDSRWHDADRINGTHFAIADISEERLIVVDVRSDSIEYEWRMDDAFDRKTTGDSDDPNDWAHLNDVEHLRDGTFMLSPRNHDQVVFVRRGEGLIESRTLGNDDDYDVLYEQHNPDYLYGENKQNSVIVADSQNNRIVEFDRVNGSWKQSWVWKDAQLRWPRDADRLPNGNTLVTDTSGHRVVEVTPQGKVVWGIRVKGGYDAERLGTGDESAGGKPISEIPGSQSRTESPLIRLPAQGRLGINGLLFVSPPWVTVEVILVGVLGLVSGAAWLLWTGWLRFGPLGLRETALRRIQRNN